MSLQTSPLEAREIDALALQLRMLRLWNTLPSIALYFLIAIRSNQPDRHVIFGAIAMMSAYGALAIVGDALDEEADLINARRLPLSSDLISRNGLPVMVAVLMGVVALCQLAMEQPFSLVVTFMAIVVAIAYAAPPLRLKARCWYGTVALALCYGIFPILLGRGNDIPVGWMSSTLLAVLLAVSSMLLLKDVKDERGDRATGVKTPIVHHSLKRVMAVAIVLQVLAVLVLRLNGANIVGLGLMLISVAVLVKLAMSSPFSPSTYAWQRLFCWLGLLATVPALVSR